MRSEFWLVAGPNGAGKSTTATPTVPSRIPVLNPDEECSRIHAALPRWLRALHPGASRLLANWRAVERIERRLRHTLVRNESIGIETVLSTPKYERHIFEARRRGYSITLLFVALPDAELHIRRVRQRVQASGHDVPMEKIRARWERSHRMLERFEPLVDRLVVFDNSRLNHRIPDPVIVAEKRARDARVSISHPNLLPRVTEALLRASRRQ